jgi:putative restriction endonuclease
MTSPAAPYIAVTNPNWFEFLRARAGPAGLLDEVNFWNPGGRPLKSFAIGTPVFLRLKSPFRRIAGFGFFATFQRLALRTAWDLFGERNGCSDMLELSALTGRGLDDEIGCTVLRDVALWTDAEHAPWSDEEGWRGAGPQRGKTELDESRAATLLAYLRRNPNALPDELETEEFDPFPVDEREVVLARSRPRVGQGTFRARLLGAYGGRCAITGEHTQVVLDGAHIQPYLGPRSNRLQNGLLLTKEFHALFDEGLVTVTPDYVVRVSRHLREKWKNGHRYYPYDDRPLLVTPQAPAERPGRRALAWHGEHVFRD